MSRTVPEYRRHPNSQAFVQHRSIPTRDRQLYLEKHGSDESIRKYPALVLPVVNPLRPWAYSLQRSHGGLFAEYSAPPRFSSGDLPQRPASQRDELFTKGKT